MLGELRPGWLADLVLLDWRAIRGAWCPPDFPAPGHIPEFLLRRSNRSHVRHVMVHGQWALRNGAHTQLDAAALDDALRECLSRQRPAAAHGLGPHVKQFYASGEDGAQ